MNVQNQMSSDLVEQFDRPLSVSMITKGQDWRTRQAIDYEASKGFLKDDFLGLKDWAEQIQIYSSATFLLRGSYLAIKALIPRNRNVLMQLTRIPGIGLVGRLLATIHGFEKVFVAPQDTLQAQDGLKRFGV